MKQLESYEIKDKYKTEIDIQTKSENFRKMGALKKLHNIVIHTRNSLNCRKWICVTVTKALIGQV
jgi:hypothetical protein